MSASGKREGDSAEHDSKKGKQVRATVHLKCRSVLQCAYAMPCQDPACADCRVGVEQGGELPAVQSLRTHRHSCSSAARWQ